VSRARDLTVTGALLCAVAALLGLPALLIPGLAALLAGTLSRAWVGLAASHARVTLQTTARTLSEGDSVGLTITVSRGRIPFPGVSLKPWPEAGAIAPPSGRSGQVALGAVATRRGRQMLGPALLRVADPLEIHVRELRSAEQELLVLPRVYPISAPALGRLAGGRSPLDAALELDSIRPHGADAPASRIHWPALARTGSLIERSFTAEADTRVLVALDARAVASEQALDQALRATASLCVYLARRGGCRLLLPDDRRASVIGPDLRAWPALHARLALVQAGTGGPRDAHPRRQDTVLYVTASASGQPPACSRCYRVSPLPLTGVAVAFSVAGCSGQLLDRAAYTRSA